MSIFKTPEQFDLGHEMGQKFIGMLIDLTRTSTNRLIWGDGTYMTPLEEASYIYIKGSPPTYLYQLRTNGIEVAHIEATRPFMCQGNTGDRTW
ncbi:hypothetical protein Hamer_G006508 [Homarus americanus]|uniref:Uncharacterized protein n=1 Tax=Homarus americanus TaxID=6706 RepID=A0A8J5JI05_HOMAM|nr:hypothetical protein Hamer_G006508 [Homarus americanus]